MQLCPPCMVCCEIPRPGSWSNALLTHGVWLFCGNPRLSPLQFSKHLPELILFFKKFSFVQKCVYSILGHSSDSSKPGRKEREHGIMERDTHLPLTPSLRGFTTAPHHSGPASSGRFSIMRFVSHSNNSEMRMHLKRHNVLCEIFFNIF